jgi:hypothetical protein
MKWGAQRGRGHWPITWIQWVFQGGGSQPWTPLLSASCAFAWPPLCAIWSTLAVALVPDPKENRRALGDSHVNLNPGMLTLVCLLLPARKTPSNKKKKNDDLVRAKFVSSRHWPLVPGVFVFGRWQFNGDTSAGVSSDQRQSQNKELCQTLVFNCRISALVSRLERWATEFNTFANCDCIGAECIPATCVEKFIKKACNLIVYSHVTI